MTNSEFLHRFPTAASKLKPELRKHFPGTRLRLRWPHKQKGSVQSDFLKEK